MPWFNEEKQPVVLVVDDNKELVAILSMILEGQKYRVLRAFSGLEALQTAGQSKPDLVILDIMMPGMAGTDVLSKLQSQPETKNIPVIMCTAQNDIAQIDKCTQLGCSGYILKPFERAKVLGKVKEILYKGAQQPK